jgi:hypothetical protein
LHDVFIEYFRRELNEIQGPMARKLFVLAQAGHLAHLQVASYVTLIAMADTVGHPGVGVLLESCLTDKLAFLERTRHETVEMGTHLQVEPFLKFTRAHSLLFCLAATYWPSSLADGNGQRR